MSGDELDSSAFACDRCDGSLLADEDVRYEVKISVVAAYDPMEINPASLAEVDLQATIDRLDQVTAGMSADELEATVFKELRFDLCLRCQREFLHDPLGKRALGR